MPYNLVAALWLLFFINPEDPEMMYSQLDQLDIQTLDNLRLECNKQMDDLRQACPELFYPYPESKLNSDDLEQAQSKKDFLDTVLEYLNYE